MRVKQGLDRAGPVPVVPENPNLLHLLNFSAAGLNLRARRVLLAGVVEGDETGPCASACLNLDLAAIQAIHEQGDCRPAPPTPGLPTSFMVCLIGSLTFVLGLSEPDSARNSECGSETDDPDTDIRKLLDPGEWKGRSPKTRNPRM